MRLLVCGGAGFIGSNFVRVRVRDHGDDVVVLDKLTYAGRKENLQDVEHEFVHGAIEDPQAVTSAMEGVDAVVNFAAETHVDRSIAEPDAFVTTHALGTYVLLETARAQQVRYVQVSTDEYAIVRTAWLFGAGGRNFVDTMLALGEERDDAPVLPPWQEGLAAYLTERAVVAG